MFYNKMVRTKQTPTKIDCFGHKSKIYILHKTRKYVPKTRRTRFGAKLTDMPQFMPKGKERKEYEDLVNIRQNNWQKIWQNKGQTTQAPKLQVTKEELENIEWKEEWDEPVKNILPIISGKDMMNVEIDLSNYLNHMTITYDETYISDEEDEEILTYGEELEY